MLKSGQDRRDCTNVKLVEHAENQNQTHNEYKINTIKLIHFKLLADRPVKRFTVIMK